MIPKNRNFLRLIGRLSAQNAAVLISNGVIPIFEKR